MLCLTAFMALAAIVFIMPSRSKRKCLLYLMVISMLVVPLAGCEEPEKTPGKSTAGQTYRQYYACNYIQNNITEISF